MEPRPFLWPDKVLDLGPRTLIPFTPCQDFVRLGKSGGRPSACLDFLSTVAIAPNVLARLIVTLLTRMAPCGTGTWIAYGAHPLCFQCAQLRSLDNHQPRDVCPVCRRSTWWVSHSGRRICRRCHPPAPGAEARA